MTTRPWSFSARRASSQDLTRLYQLGVSALVAWMLYVFYVPLLIDHLPRWVGAAVAPQPVSGEIVLVDITNDRSFTAISIAERQAEAVSLASKQGAQAIFIEGQFVQTDSGIEALGKSIAASDAPVTIGWSITYAAEENSSGIRVDRRASFPNVTEAIQADRVLPTRFRAFVDGSIEVGGRRYATFSSAIAGKGNAAVEVPIDYRYAIGTIPVHSLQDFRSGKVPPSWLRGKRVVIGASTGALDRTVLVPNEWNWVPSIFADIVSAETLRSGPPVEITNLTTFLLTLLLLYVATTLPRKARRRMYAVVSMLVVAIPLGVAPFGPVVGMGSAVTMLVVFFTMRYRTLARERAAGTERLSGLPNFHALEDDYAAATGRLVIAKVDNFEEILASLEPAQHSEFVQQIAKRLSVGSGQKIYTDTSGHFAWFEDLENAKSHVAGLLALTSAPLKVADRTLDFACSFGLLDCAIEKPRQAISATVVAADKAGTRPSRIAYVSEQDGYDANWQLSLLASLDEAISKEQIYLAFQPQVRLDDDTIVGVEALVRWRHPERGVISPSQFIPQIERAGRLKPLTAHTLRLAARASQKTAPANVRVSVNISATIIADDDFVNFVQENIRAGGGQPSAITIEITETARIPSIERAARNLQALQRIGYHVALDDFGTGEANLSLLVSLPCDEIKIDRSFVVLAQHSERARMVIAALARTAQLAGMRLVAEGIETDEDRNGLRELGCPIGQGYLLGKPQFLPQFLQMLEADRRQTAVKLTLY
ncbi:EAL domain-containing protein [Croceicoccus sp. BE223]|uniref:EAL domain-containing protein n=1 Tax=Croceicoccus sp. BE223 TaxID=2817716 RepID=UPI0028625E96|nr:EAL domain-containing protein [Croceicoccus sp. BE223]MDR7103188.1 EAL domain-containing protein (putative c-di-GMP-specific phosphodiesterase class I) [Croceicoccus sp. BE223]